MPPHQIRIIGGRWRGRRIRFPVVADVRPTPDRVRETLFNWLGQDLTGRTTIDPFTGSGALSLEALSRGATLAVAVDRQASLVRALATTGIALGTTALETHCADANAFLARERRAFDVVFLDPPFTWFAVGGHAGDRTNAGDHARGDSTAQRQWSALLAAAAARVAPDGALYIEAPTAIEAPAGFGVVRRDRAGQVHYHLLRREQDVDAARESD